MTPVFFPDITFGWFFYCMLMACCLVAVVTDMTWQRLPNWVSVPTCLVGLILNLVRGAWLGYQDVPGRYFGFTGVFGGLIEGLCFALAGLAVAFALFVLLMQLGKCGAGDVKWMAAVGTWVGPFWFLFIFAATIVAVIPILLFWWAYAFATRKNPGLKLSYALPAMLGTSLMLLWLWRKSLFV